MKKKTAETSEKKTIKDYLDLMGVFYYHNLAGLGCYAGIADITAIYKGKVYQIEVKIGKNTQLESQKKFQRNWEQAGGNYILGGYDEVKAMIKK